MRRQSVPDGITGVIQVKTHVRFDNIVPVEDIVDGIEHFDSPFDLTKEPFDLPLVWGCFTPVRMCLMLLCIMNFPNVWGACSWFRDETNWGHGQSGSRGGVPYF